MKYLLMISLIIGSQLALASGAAVGFEVDYVRVDKTGKGFVTFKSPLVSNPVACGSDYASSLAFDTNTAGGKSIMSLVLTAQASGRVITARGTGHCDVYSVIESWNYGHVQ